MRLTTQHPKQWEIHGRGQSVMDRDVDSGLDRWVAPQGAVHALMQLRRIEDGEPLQTWKEHMAQGGICPFEGLTRDMGVRNRFAPSLDALVSDDPQQNRGHVIEPAVGDDERPMQRQPDGVDFGSDDLHDCPPRT